jgi:AraC-like DNA-binding protein
MGFTSVAPKSIVVLVLNLGFIYFISFGGMRQPKIFTEKLQYVLQKTAPEADTPKPETEKEKAESKYLKSGLETSRLESVWQSLNQHLESKRPYLDDELTLPQLAEQLGEKPHDLSQVINSQSGKNFYELINRYRVAEAKELLINPEHRKRKMLDIATEVGFKSQSTFYTQFKKHSGMTPRQYREQNMKQLPDEPLTTP